jgi:endonuclease YncB( thermonuclease family)
MENVRVLEKIRERQSKKKTKRFTLAGFDGPALCEHVYDGDTPHLTFQPWDMPRAFRWTCRMARIQCPEMKGSNILPAEKELALHARDNLASLIKGEIVRVEVTSMGKYRRPVVEIYASGRNVNDLMLESGHAVPYGSPLPWRPAEVIEEVK